MTLTLKQEDEVRERLQDGEGTLIRSIVLAPIGRRLFNVLLYGGLARPFDVDDDEDSGRVQISMHERAVVIEMLLAPQPENGALFDAMGRSGEAVILSYDVSDETGFSNIKAQYERVSQLVCISIEPESPPQRQVAPRRLLDRLTGRPRSNHAQLSPVIVVAVSFPGLDSTQCVTREQGELFCESIGGTFAEVTVPRVCGNPSSCPAEVEAALSDLTKRVILRRISSKSFGL